MKRITQGSSASLNETAFESLKPLYGSKGNAPYYDPNDLHVHIWKKGKLGLEDNPKIPTYAKGKLVIKDCVYCKVCHMMQDSFQSSIGQNRDIVTDIIRINDESIGTNGYSGANGYSGYRIIEPVVVEWKPELTCVPKANIDIPNEINQKLFHKQEGVFDEYVQVEEDNCSNCS